MSGPDATTRRVGLDRTIGAVIFCALFAFYVAIQRGEVVSWDGRIMAGVAVVRWAATPRAASTAVVAQRTVTSRSPRPRDLGGSCARGLRSLPDPGPPPRRTGAADVDRQGPEWTPTLAP